MHSQIPQNENLSDVTLLKKLFFEEANAADEFARLARIFARPARNVLLRIAAEERKHLERLQLEYFILTGDTIPISKSTPKTDGKLSVLRLAYNREMQLAESYLNVAEVIKDQSFKEFCTTFASEEKEHAMILRKLILSAMRMR